MLRTIFITILISVASELYGQAPQSYRYADSVTYNYYLEKRWNDLISAAKMAVRDGHDYYYLRMRMGIAYYEKNNYAMSAIQFRKALAFNENDQVAMEYLFYAYYLSGHSSRAWALLSSFYPQNRERIINESKIKRNNITLESFYSDTGTDYILSDPGSYFTVNEPGSQIATKYFINNTLSATHILGNNISYSHAYTNLIKDNYLHYSNGTYNTHLYPQNVIQNQYYGSLNIFTSRGLTISPAFHVITSAYPLVTISTIGMNVYRQVYDIRTSGYFAGVAISGSLGFLDIGTETGYIHFNYMESIQQTVSVMIYPTGNSSVYFGGRISVKKNLLTPTAELGFTEGVTAGFSVFNKVWFEFSGLTGDLFSYSDKNGMYIYNSTDILENKVLGRIIIPFNKIGMSCFAGGGVALYSSEYIDQNGTIISNVNKIKYRSNNFTGGISWNF